jgi:hypothetical protein
MKTINLWKIDFYKVSYQQDKEPKLRIVGRMILATVKKVEIKHFNGANNTVYPNNTSWITTKLTRG